MIGRRKSRFHDILTADERSKFFANVTVAGLTDYQRSDGRLSRIFWTVVLLTSASLICFDCYLLYVNIISSSDTFNEYTFVVGENLQIPNVTICLPVGFNKSKLQELLFIPDEVLVRLNRKNKTVEQFFDGIMDFLSYSMLFKKIDEFYYRLYLTCISHPANDDIAYYQRSTFNALLPSCEETVKSCRFQQRTFNCCNRVSMLAGDSMLCYKIPFNVPGDEKFLQTVPGADGGAEFDVWMDTRYAMNVDGTFVDGFHIYVDHTANVFRSPVAAWTFTHVHIRVVAKQLHQISDCFSTPPALKFMDYYDPTGTHCNFDVALRNSYMGFGCLTPTVSFIPERNACDVGGLQLNRYFFMFGMYLNLSTPETKSSDKQSSSSGAANDEYVLTRRSFGGDGICKTLCNMWTYQLFVSYTALHDEIIDRQTTIQRGRVSIFYGDFDHLTVSERPNTDEYTVFSQIGNICGLYGGISVVTFVQLFFYGIVWAISANRHVRLC